MAYVNKRNDADTYIACIRDRAGKLTRKSTGVKDRETAQLIADTWEQLARGNIGQRRLMEVANILRGVPTITVRDYCESWLAAREPEWKPATRAFYRSTAKCFVDGLPNADIPINQVGKQDVLKWRDGLLANITKRTANQRLKGVRSIFRGALEDELIEINPAQLVTTFKAREEDKGRREAFTADQVRALLRVADGEWRGLILLGLYTGLRLGDVARLQWKDVDLASGFISVVTLKTEQQVRVAMPTALAEYLGGLSHREGYLHPESYGFVKRSKGQQSVTLSNQFAKLLIRAGLREGTLGNSRVSVADGRAGRRKKHPLVFHSLRHTLVSMMKEEGVPASVVMSIAGHKSEAISQRYTHTSDAALRDAASKMPDVTAG